MNVLKFFPAVLLLVAAPIFAKENQALRLVTIGSAVSETVCALGYCDQIVASDDTSLYPEILKDRPRMGYFRQISAEGILSLNPTMVLATTETAPESALEQIRKAGVKVHMVDGKKNLAAAKLRIQSIAETLGSPAKGSELVKKLEFDVAWTEAKVANVKEKPRVLFIYARGANHMQVGGKDSAAIELVKMAGGESATNSFEGYKPFSPEALVEANPDVILLTTSGAKSLGSGGEVTKLPGVQYTKAGLSKRIVVVDDLLLLGFGPRTGEALKELHQKLFTDKP